MDLSEVTENPHRHPWELSRAGFILNLLEGKKKLDENLTLLDIGAGDLYFSLRTHFKTRVKVDAVDHAFENEQSRIAGVEMLRDLDQVAHRQYDAICAMDVLEHVEDDEALLNRMIHLLKPDGVLILTVPAFQVLYSFHDLKLKHFRRYHRGHLLYLIQNPDHVETLESFYFFHCLLYVRIFQKLAEFFFGVKPKLEDQIHSINQWRRGEKHPITRGLSLILGADARLCRALARIGIRLPGLSLCMVIRKKA